MRTKVRELEKKYEILEEGLNAATQKISGIVASVDHFYEVYDAHLPPNLSMMIKNYVKLSNRKPQGYCYSNELKQIALKIYFFIAYRVLKIFYSY